MIRSFQDIKEELKDSQVTVAVAAAEDPGVLESVAEIKKENLGQFRLIGDADQIRQIADEMEIPLSAEEVVDSKNNQESAQLMTQLIRDGEAHIPMKGLMGSSTYLKAILNRETGFRTSKLLSHISFVENPYSKKLLMLTDCALNTYPDLDQKIQITENAVEYGHLLGIDKPKVAMLSFVETVNNAAVSSQEAAILSKMSERGQLGDCIVEGPLAIDNILFKGAAEKKGIVSEVAGDADIIVMPSIDAGNPLFKTLTMVAGFEAAGLVAGASIPVIMTPRADPIESKINAIVLAQYIYQQANK